MTVINPEYAIDETVLDKLDWEIVCESETYHQRLNLTPERADYLIEIFCSHCKESVQGYLGKRCLNIAWSRPKLRCDYCKKLTPSMEMIKIISVL